MLFRSDGGNTFPTVLAASTPNDGSEAVVIPVGNTTTARIKVECANNIFFDISNTNFTVSGAIPVTFLSFQAIKDGSTVRLNWQTTNESNIDYYNVQTSTDRIHFSNIANRVVTGNGSAGTNTYTAQHLNPVAGENYYRIAEVDKDGRINYSPVEAVYFDALSVPVISYVDGSSVDIHVPAITKAYGIRLFNSIGQEVISKKNLTQTHTTLNIGKLSKGVYMLNVYYNDQVYSFKVLK